MAHNDVLGRDGMLCVNICVLSDLIKKNIMPVRKVSGGYQWGTSGKVYPTKAQAERQGRAIRASGWTEQKGGK